MQNYLAIAAGLAPVLMGAHYGVISPDACGILAVGWIVYMIQHPIT